MKRPIVRIAMAVAVILVGVGALSLWTGTKSGVALADVLTKLEQVRAFTYKMTMHMKGTMPGGMPMDTHIEGFALIAAEYGMRMDTTTTNPNMPQGVTQQMYMLPDQKKIVALTPALKQYMRMEFDEETFERERRQKNDPRLMLKEILGCQYTDLGPTVLDGIEVQGFQTTDSAFARGMGDVDVKLWVAMNTKLPVRMEMKFQMGEQMEMEGALHDFQWDVPVSAAEFTPVIPADFTPSPGDGMKTPPLTEETALSGLKLCRELNGKYPDDLNLMTLIQMATQSFQGSLAPDTAKVRRPEDATVTPEEAKKKLMDEVQEGVKKAMDKMMPIQALGGFYLRLVEEKKEPAYYGKVVKPGDVAQVLLRWKVAENQYRVIFADLHAETVNAETLATLEAALPK